MNEKTFSIITVVFNAKNDLIDTIKSLRQQNYKNFEYIIIDGASTDTTLEKCIKYENKIFKIVSEMDKGIYDAMNKGIELATGDIIGILNADDFYANKDVLKDVVRQFKNKDIQGLYANLVYVDGVDTSKVTRTWIAGEYKTNAFKKGWMPPHPTFFVKKECYSKYGGYSLNLRSAADYELMLKLIHKHNIKVGYLNKITVKMRVGGVSNSSLKNRLRANREDKMAWKINGLKPGLLTFIRKPLSKIGQFFKK